MYRFIRTTTARAGAAMPTALQFAIDVTAYLNKRYDLKIRFGAEQFGSATLYWFVDGESLDALAAINAKLLQDREYLALLDRAKDLWVEGSLKDILVQMPE